MKISENKYIDIIFNLYEEFYLKNHYNIKSKRLFKKNDYNDETKRAINNYHKLCENMKNPFDYDSLCKFADFIRVIEKVYFYTNDPNKNIVSCNSPWDANRKEIVINSKEKDVVIKLTMDYDYNDKLSNRLQIHVERNFGNKIKGGFVVYGGDLEYEDDSDLMLINSLNEIICNSFINLLVEIAEAIMNYTIFERFEKDDI